MKTLATLVACIALAVPAFAQETTASPLPTVSVSAKGTDVRSVLHDMFTQQKKSYVLDPGVRFALYLSLNDIDFDEALTIVCKTSGLKYELQNGIYFLSKGIAKPAPPVVAKQEAKPIPKPAETKPVEEKPRGIVPSATFQKRVTTRFSKVPIRDLFADISKQVGVEIEVDKSVPNYKLDAYLIDTSLKYAIDQINWGAGLAYKLTNNRSILIYVPKKEETSRVQVISDSGTP
jgi:type II secretory pathway component HofQ